jgi:hypothetical protein
VSRPGGFSLSRPANLDEDGNRILTELLAGLSACQGASLDVVTHLFRVLVDLLPQINCTTNRAAALTTTSIIPDTHNCKIPEGLSVAMQPDPALKKR